MSWLPPLLHALLLLLAPVLVVGVINRVKARWSGRVGPPLLQLAYDLARLSRKATVRSAVASWFVQLGPVVLLATTLVAGAFVPLVSGYAPAAFEHDFVAFAYLLGLGRLLMVLSAMDSGSAFEGMGASREAQLAVLVEPALFLVLGSLAVLGGRTSFASLSTALDLHPAAAVAVRVAAFVALLLLLQVEAARVPVDDPTTHLELTMIHEVMVLDHSGPDLAFVQYAAAMKLTLCAALAAGVLNPIGWADSPAGALASSALLVAGVAVLVGLVESLVARLRLEALPRYLLVGVLAGLLALVVTAFAGGRAA